MKSEEISEECDILKVLLRSRVLWQYVLLEEKTVERVE